MQSSSSWFHCWAMAGENNRSERIQIAVQSVATSIQRAVCSLQCWLDSASVELRCCFAWNFSAAGSLFISDKNLHVMISLFEWSPQWIMIAIRWELLGAIKYNTAANTACVLNSREVRGHALKQFITPRKVFHGSGLSLKHETRWDKVCRHRPTKQTPIHVQWQQQQRQVEQPLSLTT